MIDKKIEDLGREMAWFVGRTLSYIDITVDTPKESGDKYSKKEVLKKLFEKEIYAVRNVLYAMEEGKVIKNMPAIFEALEKQLITIASASISDPLCRNSFTMLISQSSEEVQAKIKKALSMKGD